MLVVQQMGERIALRRCQRVLVAGMRQSFCKSAVCGQARFGGCQRRAGIIGKERRCGLCFLQMVIEGENVPARFYHAFLEQIAVIGVQVVIAIEPIVGDTIEEAMAIRQPALPFLIKRFVIQRLAVFVQFRHAGNGIAGHPLITVGNVTNRKTALLDGFENIARDNGLCARIDSAITV